MSKTEIELGIRRRVATRKCGCKYRAEDDAAVTAGYELGGYLVSSCQKHAQTTVTAARICVRFRRSSDHRGDAETW